MQIKKYYIQTFGCQMNVADSNAIASHLESRGFIQCDTREEADIIVLNTCTVREHAEHKAMSFIGRLKPFKEAKPGLKIIVTGCAAERLGGKLRRKFSIIDLTVGAKQIEHFPEIFDNAFPSLAGAGRGASAKRTLLPPRAKESDEIAFVTIIRGCQNFCSYCIVPYVRGPEISRTAADIISEVKAYASEGFKDVMLLGQNVNSYHSTTDSGAGVDFPSLLVMINNIKGIERIRFMTSHPKDLSDKLIDTMATLDKLCPHLHLPMQSGSDRILNAMNRKYTVADYTALADKIRRKVPGISLTTDILVGFPGEADDDFIETLTAIENIGFNALFAFKYSSRGGTTASKLPETVTEDEKEHRLQKVLELADRISTRANSALVGSTVEVLVEKTNGGTCTGRTRSNIKVFFPAPPDRGLNGLIMNVTITKAKINTLIGEISAPERDGAPKVRQRQSPRRRGRAPCAN